MRIGLFGGTFDPVHYGHLRMAIEVVEHFALDACYLIPASVPPHKRHADPTPAAIRLEMTRLAVSGTDRLRVSDVEIERAGPSYSIDTVRAFQETFPEPNRLFLVMGIDAFVELHTWKSVQEILAAVPLIAVNRPHDTGPDALQPRAERYLAATFGARAYRYAPDEACFTSDGRQPVHLFSGTLLAISSTDIRERVADGRSIHYLLPPRVAAVIAEKGLYR